MTTKPEYLFLECANDGRVLRVDYPGHERIDLPPGATNINDYAAVGWRLCFGKELTDGFSGSLLVMTREVQPDEPEKEHVIDGQVYSAREIASRPDLLNRLNAMLTPPNGTTYTID